MLGLPEKIVILDIEWTSWPGSLERKWSGPNEYREIVQIGALLVKTEDFTEEDTFTAFVLPKKNPTLSKYFVKLTGITQKMINKNGVDFPTAFRQFYQWCSDFNLYSWGSDEFGTDDTALKENCDLHNIDLLFDKSRFFDIRTIFRNHNVPVKGYSSGTIIEVFGKKSSCPTHDGISDSRTILAALRELNKKRGQFRPSHI